jgi:hypothetical protein
MLVIWFLGLISITTSIDVNTCVKVFQHFSTQNYTILVTNGLDINEQTTIVKKLSQTGQMVKLTNLDDANMELPQDISFNIVTFIKKSTLVSFQDMFDRHNNIIGTGAVSVMFLLDNIHLDVTINQEVYFVNMTNWSVFEQYNVNNVTINNNLGYFDVNNKFKTTYIGNRFMLERRSNFQNVNFIGMTEFEPPFIYLDDLKSKATFYTNNQTYDVTNLASGMFHEMLLYLQSKLNFTTKLYKRKDSGWGTTYKEPNGTLIQSTGMVKNIVNKQADIIATR